MIDEEIKLMIKRHEGFRPYVYVDSLGYLTGGYGHAFLPGSRISHDVANLLFKEDFEGAVKGYDKLGIDLDPIRRGAMIDMIYQLGLSGVWGLRKMLNHLRNRNYDKAHDEALDSLWAQQTTYRAQKIAKILKTGTLDGVAIK